MNLVFYNCNLPKIFQDRKTVFEHSLYYVKNTKILVPKTFCEETINPLNFFSLKQKLSFNSICIIDKVYPDNGPVCIIDHVNRSGFNFLAGKTPVKNLPTFPDMSRIYNPIKDLKQVVVHTVGPKRFHKEKNVSQIISESVGLLSPVWHYVGVGVFSKNKMGLW